MSFTKGFTDGGGQIVGSVRMPPQNPDFIPFVQRIKDAKPDVAFFFVPADPQATAFIKARSATSACVKRELASPRRKICCRTRALPNVGDTPLGIITSGMYSTAGKRPTNQSLRGPPGTRSTATNSYPTSCRSAAGTAWPRSST